MHFDESASFDLLKDNIMFPENDSLDADLDMEMTSAPARKVLGDRDQGGNIIMPIPEADAESESEIDCVGMLGERLRDVNIVEERDDFWQNKDGEGNDTSTPPEQLNNCNVACQYFICHVRSLPLKRDRSLQLRRCQYASPSSQRTTRRKFLLRPLLDVMTHLRRLDEAACAHRYLPHFPCLHRHLRLRRSQKRKGRNQE